ncbi:MAG: hypothetical protein AAFQ82_10700 [Myxococcota bacterium]
MDRATYLLRRAMMHTVGDPWDSAEGVHGAAAHLRGVQPHSNAVPPHESATRLDLNNDGVTETVFTGSASRPDSVTVNSPWLLRGLNGPRYYSRTLSAAPGPSGALDTPRLVGSVTELYRFVQDGEMRETQRTFSDTDGDGEVDSIVTQRATYGPVPETRSELEEMLLHPRGTPERLGTSGFFDADGEEGLERLHEDGSITPADDHELVAQRLSLPGLIELDPFEEDFYRREGER